MTRKYKRLTKAEYARALKHPKWQKKRLLVFKRDKWACRTCGATDKTLCVHHSKYTKKYPYNEPMKNLITLCEDCHKKLHKN